MPPRRKAQSRKADNPSSRKKSAPSKSMSNTRRDGGTDNVNHENHARKRQRRESNHQDDATNEQVHMAEPLSDASNFAVQPSTTHEPPGVAFEYTWPVGQARELQWDRSNVSADTGGLTTHALSPVAGSSFRGHGRDAPDGLSAMTNQGLRQLAFPHVNMNDPMERNQPLNEHSYDLFAESRDAVSVGQGNPGSSMNPASFNFLQTYGLGDVAFYPSDNLAPLLAAADDGYTGPPVGDLLDGTTSNGLLFADTSGLPFAGDYGLQSVGDDGLLGYPGAALGQPGMATDSPEDMHGGACDPSMIMASPHAAFGRYVQTNNTIEPQAQPQPSGSGAQASDAENETATILDATEGSGEEQEADEAGDFKCGVCRVHFLKRTGLRNHKMRHHNRFRINFGDNFPCALCGKNRTATNGEQYNRHRMGSGVPQCSVMATVNGDYDALMRHLVEAELAKGGGGKGLECLAHWQFGGEAAQCFQGLCKAWHKERMAQGKLWLAMKGYDDCIPIMDLVDAQGEGEHAMKWAATDKFYEPGTEPGVARKGREGKKDDVAKGEKKGKKDNAKGKRKAV